jgi:hypothetical protein
MARIRLRNCDIRLYDGFVATAVVNDTPANLDTVLTIVTTSGIIAIGSRFIIVGANRVYTVTAVSGSPNTTQITFTPALATADGIPAGDAAISFTGRTLDVRVNEGTFAWEVGRAYDYELLRGTLSTVAPGDDIPVSLNFDVQYDFITAVTGSGIPQPEDVLKQRGEAASWVTAGADPCEKYAVNVELDHTPPCTGVNHEIIIFPEFRYETLNHDIGGSRLAVAGKCKITTITPTRRAF